MFPRWVPFGCGAASLVAISGLVVAGVLVGSGRASGLFAMLFSTMEGEIHGIMTKEVTPAQKAALDAEMKTLRSNLDAGKVSINHVQPLLQAIRDASLDDKVTPAETQKLTKAIHEVNRAAAQRATRNNVH